MNKKLKTKIYSLAYGGKGVGKIDGKVCFVEGALPGEEVLFIREKEQPKFLEGKVCDILSASEDRVVPVCPYYGQCGGCQLQHLDYSKELYYKQEQVSDLLSRIGGVERFECLSIEASDKEYGYRNTIELHLSQRGQYGFYKRKSKEILSIDNCPVAVRSINERLSGDINNTRGANELTLKGDHLGNVWASDRAGERFFKDRYRNKDLYFAPKAFSQANRCIAEGISSTLDEWIGKDNGDSVFFDAYCGMGFFTFLSECMFDLYIGLDESRVAIDCAKTTKRERGVDKTKFYRGIVEKDFFDIFDRNSSKRNIVFMDPPRKGAGKCFLEELRNKKNIEKIYYLSCDPAKLARDVKILTAGDIFRLSRVKPFDMFPRTMHIETLAELVRNRAL